MQICQMHLGTSSEDFFNWISLNILLFLLLNHFEYG